ncbi:MAG: hypothetical protein HZA95_00165 [Candidatus Vogelbacteria bacterium]|nr:hypothetical protein [Candidatus Vogelbacteria bacterium]
MFGKKFMESRKSVHIIFSLIGIILLILVFKAGEHFGYRRASFSYQYGDNFHRTFGYDRGSRSFGMGMMGNRDYLNAFGAAGKVVSINLPEIVVTDRSGVEKTVLINNETEVMSQREKLTSSDLKIGDAVVVFGEPDLNGKIDAKLVRVMPMNSKSKQINTDAEYATSTKI